MQCHSDNRQNRLCHRFNSDDHSLSPVDCTPRSSKSYFKSLKRSKHDDATDKQQRIQEMTTSVTGEPHSRDICVENPGIINDTKTATVSSPVASCYSAADDNCCQSLPSEDESQTYITGHCDQKCISDIFVEPHSCVDSSSLSESSAVSDVDNGSIPLLNANDSQCEQWESQKNMSAEDDVCSEMSGEDCIGTEEHSEQNAEHSSVSPMTVTVTADVHAPPPQSPLLSPPLYSDTSFADEEDGVGSHSSQAEEVEQVGDGVMKESYETRMRANAQRDGRPAEHRWRLLFNAAKFG